MAVLMNSYPFTSQVTTDEHGDPVYDRAVTAEFLQAMYRKDRSYGVIMLTDSTALRVVAAGGMKVKVNPGYCFARGCYGMTEEDTQLTLEAADSNYDRIDTIVAKLNTNMDYRGIYLDIKQGTPAASPTPPGLQRTGGIWELGLANIQVKKGATAIEQQYITDTRYNPLKCGVSLPLQEFDTEGLYLQIQDQINRNLELINHALDDTEAGYLRSLIDAANARIDTNAGKITGLEGRLTGVESRTLLWENASPTSAFAAQTIAIDLSDYDYYMIEFRNETGMNTTQTLSAKTEFGLGMQPFFCYPNPAVTGKIVLYSRIVYLRTAGLQFDDGHVTTTNEYRTGSTPIIPIRIWGIKEA